MEYRREKQVLDDKLTSLVVPGVDAAMEAGKLLEDLPKLWEQAGLGERRRKLLLTMLDGVYVDAKEEKAIVAVRPKPAFRPLFVVAATREGSGVVLIRETPPGEVSPGEVGPRVVNPEASGQCSWWRRGRVELPVQKTP